MTISANSRINSRTVSAVEAEMHPELPQDLAYVKGVLEDIESQMFRLLIINSSLSCSLAPNWSNSLTNTGVVQAPSEQQKP